MGKCELKLKIKRVYEDPVKGDGVRVLVDRLWPRGVKKENAKIDFWMKDIAPSDNLRRWFSHRDERWQEFRKRYLKELRDKKDSERQLKELAAKNKKITLLYAAKDEKRNNAEVLLEFLEKK